MTVGEPIAATEIAGLLQHTKVYDVDTHITEPRDLWTSRLPASKWGDYVPHTRLDDSGREYWWVGAKKCSPAVGGASNAGWSKGLYPKSTPTTYE